MKRIWCSLPIAAALLVGSEPIAEAQHPRVRLSTSESLRIELEVDYPPNGAAVRETACGAFVAGRALALEGHVGRFDVVIVIDTSESTLDSTGVDVDGDGIVGIARMGPVDALFRDGMSDRGDSILAAEVAAARQLLRGFDPRSTRVAVVSFAGSSPDGRGRPFWRKARPSALTRQTLTRDYGQVESALLEMLEENPAGLTDMAAGVDQATGELFGLGETHSAPDFESEKVVFFFTDGKPSLPYPGFEADNVRAVLRAADRARRDQIRIHTFAIGRDALDGPIAPVELAARTDGVFTPVRHPGDLKAVVEEVAFAGLTAITVHNATTGQPAQHFRATADGTWSSFVRTVRGTNRIEIRAEASDGTSAREVLRLRTDPQAPARPVPEHLVVERNRLLEDCLVDVMRGRRAAERRHAEQVRRDLRMEIQRERDKALQRAAEQRKQLRLEYGDE